MIRKIYLTYFFILYALITTHTVLAQEDTNSSYPSEYTQDGLTTQGLFSQKLYDQGLYSQGLYEQGLYSQGLYEQGLYSQGLYEQGLYSQGLYEQGLYSQGLYEQGLYSQGLYEQGAFIPPVPDQPLLPTPEPEENFSSDAATIIGYGFVDTPDGRSLDLQFATPLPPALESPLVEGQEILFQLLCEVDKNGSLICFFNPDSESILP